MGRICQTCKRKLGEFEGNHIPVQMGPMPGFMMPSGGVEIYCDKCYKDATNPESIDNGIRFESFSARIKRFREECAVIGIKDAEVKTNTILIGKINKKNYRIVKKDGKKLRLCECDMEDDTGFIKLILWNEKTELVIEGKVYEVKGYIKKKDTFLNTDKQITLGKYGSISEVKLN